MDNYYFSKYAHHANIDNEITILDEINDKYIILSKKQSEELIDFMKNGKATAVGGALLDDGVISSCSGTPVCATSSANLGAGLLKWTSGTELQFKHLASFKIIKTLLTLVRMRNLLKNRGLHSALNLCREQLKRIDIKPHTTLSHAEAAKFYAKQIKLLAPFLPFKIKCLEFSLTLSSLLSTAGIKSGLVIGYQRYDFLSHAWIEVDGQVILDKDHLSTRLTTIVRISK